MQQFKKRATLFAEKRLTSTPRFLLNLGDSVVTFPNMSFFFSKDKHIHAKLGIELCGASGASCNTSLLWGSSQNLHTPEAWYLRIPRQLEAHYIQKPWVSRPSICHYMIFTLFWPFWTPYLELIKPDYPLLQSVKTRPSLNITHAKNATMFCFPTFLMCKIRALVSVDSGLSELAHMTLSGNKNMWIYRETNLSAGLILSTNRARRFLPHSRRKLSILHCICKLVRLSPYKNAPMRNVWKPPHDICYGFDL